MKTKIGIFFVLFGIFSVRVVSFGQEIPTIYGHTLTDIDTALHYDYSLSERAGSCASPDGAMNSTLIAPPNYAWLQANGYCNPASYGAPVTVCWTFTTASTSVTINSGWSSTCINASFGPFTLYNSSCVAIGTGLTFSGLTIGASYTWCMDADTWGGPGCTGFTDFCPYFFNNSMLPVSFLSFAGYENGNTNTLVWSTASESGNDFFTIERSRDGINWTKLSRVEGAGNSSETLGYEWTDFDVTPVLNYYRLSQTDFDGTTEFHGILTIDNRPDVLPELVKTVNLLGEVVDENYNGIRIEIYNDGSSRKIVRYE